jgi:hypothetical protein
MNYAILERLNSAVNANDVLYVLEDFCIAPKARALELRREVRCKKIPTASRSWSQVSTIVNGHDARLARKKRAPGE